MNPLPDPHRRRARMRVMTAFFIAGIVLSGLTAIPIRTQFE